MGTGSFFGIWSQVARRGGRDGLMLRQLRSVLWGPSERLCRTQPALSLWKGEEAAVFTFPFLGDRA